MSNVATFDRIGLQANAERLNGIFGITIRHPPLTAAQLSLSELDGEPLLAELSLANPGRG